MEHPTDGAATAPAPPRHIEGYIDNVDWTAMRGWAFDPATPDRALWLEVVVDDGPPVAFLSNMHRPDLVDAGFGDGRFGFSLRFPEPLAPNVKHTVIVRVRDGGMLLPNAPVHLARAPMSAIESRTAFEAAVSAEIEAASEGPELDQTISFFLQQVDRLLQGRAESTSGSKALHQFRLRWTDFLEGARAQPLQPDTRPWVLLVDTELPDEGGPLVSVLALQSLGYRVAVVGSRSLVTTGAVAQSLAAMEVAVHGAPLHFTVEDVLRRYRGQFRAVLLRSPAVAAAYGLVARMHQPRARILSFLGDPPRDMSDGVLNLGAALVSDVVVTETPEAAAVLGGQLPGRTFQVIPADADANRAAEMLVLCGLAPQRRMADPVPAPIAPAAEPTVEQPPAPPGPPVARSRARATPRKARDPA